jgi:hypothetical protein
VSTSNPSPCLAVMRNYSSSRVATAYTFGSPRKLLRNTLTRFVSHSGRHRTNSGQPHVKGPLSCPGVRKNGLCSHCLASYNGYLNRWLVRCRGIRERSSLIPLGGRESDDFSCIIRVNRVSEGSSQSAQVSEHAVFPKKRVLC